MHPFSLGLGAGFRSAASANHPGHTQSIDVTFRLTREALCHTRGGRGLVVRVVLALMLSFPLQ